MTCKENPSQPCLSCEKREGCSGFDVVKILADSGNDDPRYGAAMIEVVDTLMEQAASLTSKEDATNPRRALAAILEQYALLLTMIECALSRFVNSTANAALDDVDLRDGYGRVLLGFATKPNMWLSPRETMLLMGRHGLDLRDMEATLKMFHQIQMEMEVEVRDLVAVDKDATETN